MSNDAVAIIPARGGSKRIPGKNRRDFAGRPMIAHPIEAALRSGVFGQVLVSTDDAEVAAIARDHGAMTPFERPVGLADDLTGTTPVVQHALAWLDEHGSASSTVCCLYPTAAFVTAGLLIEGRDLLIGAGTDYVFGAGRFRHPIQRAVRRLDDGRVVPVEPEAIPMRTQDLEPTYHDAGQFYWGRWDAWVAGRPVLGGDTAALVLPDHLVHDIDEPGDWERAELFHRAIHDSAHR